MQHRTATEIIKKLWKWPQAEFAAVTWFWRVMYVGGYKVLLTAIFWHLWKETWQDMIYTRKINSMPTLIQTNNEGKWDMNVVIILFLWSPSSQQVVSQVLNELDVISLYWIGQDSYFFTISFIVVWVHAHFCHHISLWYHLVICWMKYTFYFQRASCYFVLMPTFPHTLRGNL